MKIGIGLTNATKIQMKMRQVVEENERQRMTVQEALARHILNTVIRRMKTSRPRGIMYNRSNPARLIQASAPFQMPAIDLKRFISSIDVEKIKDGWLVGSSMKLGVWLEFGTRHMLPRPWLRPSAKLAWKSAPAIIKKTLRIKL